MTSQPHPKADACCQRLYWQDIDLAHARALIALAKEEDLEASGLKRGTRTPGDHSSELLPARLQAKAVLRARQPMIVCGLAMTGEILKAYDPELRFHAERQDSDAVEKGEALATIEGPVRSLLSAERPLLNFLQMLSGVSTETRRYVAALGDSPTRLLDTRKTTPGYRVLEKYAVTCGGGWNHRIGLFDRVMLKDNHLAAFGAQPKEAAIAAVAASRERHPEMLVEMEVDRPDQIEIAVAAGVDILMLDNFSPDELRAAVDQVAGRFVIEASGGVTLESLKQIGNIGLDFISTGALVHQSKWIDIGLDWE